MKICIVCGQIAGFGRIGGFGTMARRLAEALSRSGQDVSVCVLRTGELRGRQKMGFIPVIAPHPAAFFFGSKIFSLLSADVFHSQEPTLGTYRMQVAHPDAKHVVTCIDPRDDTDWAEEYRKFSFKKKMLYPAIRAFEDSPKVHKSVQQCHKVICQTKFIIPKVMEKYGLHDTPEFIGNVVQFPQKAVVKAGKPTVCFVGRFDKRKRPELFFELAKRHPRVHFIAIGKAHDPSWNAELHRRYSGLPNVEMLGYVDPFTGDIIESVLEKSWVLINTATREGLPAAFVEAASRQCAILATVNPDGLASRFGCFVENPDELSPSLEYLLEGDRWRFLGQSAFEYAREHFEERRVVEKHLQLYSSVLSK